MKRGQWALWEREHIPAPDGTPYLDRLRIVMTPWCSLYLHKIRQSDGDRARHDHPFVFWSWILRGCYVESVAFIGTPQQAAVKIRPRWSIHRHPLMVCHRIELVLPKTVTLVLTGRRRDGWGFYTEDGFVPWQEYDR